MSIVEPMIQELQHEAVITRKMLERVPEDKMGWKPHEKSMTLGRLASHLAEIPNWATPIMAQDELVFDPADYRPTTYGTVAELLAAADKFVAEAAACMAGRSDEYMMSEWRMRMGDTVVIEQPRMGVLRGMILNHAVHHRAQLGVYLRLLDVPLPAVYGPSADEHP